MRGESELECVPYWRIAYFQLGKAALPADLSKLNLKERERVQERANCRECIAAGGREESGCYLSINLNMATKWQLERV